MFLDRVCCLQESSSAVLSGPAGHRTQRRTACPCFRLSWGEGESILVKMILMLNDANVPSQFIFHTHPRYYRADGRITRDYLCMVRLFIKIKIFVSFHGGKKEPKITIRLLFAKEFTFYFLRCEEGRVARTTTMLSWYFFYKYVFFKFETIKN